MGNILQERGNFKKLWAREDFAWFREKRFAHEKCRACQHLAVCNGGCPLYWEKTGYGELLAAAAALGLGLPEGADIITTAISPPEEHPLQLTVRSALLADGTVKGSLKVSGDGQSDATLRRPYRGRPRSDWAAIDEGLLAAVDPRAVVRVTSRTDPDDLRVPFAIAAEFTIPGYARPLDDGSLLVVPLAARHPFGVATRADELILPLKPKQRSFPVRIGCSKLVTLDERMTLPAGASVDGLPADVKLQGAGSLQSSWKQSGAELVVTETLALDRRIFPPEEWPSLRAALEAFRTLADTPVLVKPAARGKEKA